MSARNQESTAVESLEPMPAQGGAVAAGVSAADGMMRLIERALDRPDLDLERLQKLFEMKKEFDAIEARKAFDDAMADAGGELKPIVKRQEAEAGTNRARKYEDLGDIDEVARPILAKHGLSYSHSARQDDKGLTIICRVRHRAGHFELTELTAPHDPSGGKNAIQALGSTATYLQRYTLRLALSIATTKGDLDGAAVDASATVTPEQRDQIIAMAEEIGGDTLPRLCTWKGVDSVADIRASDFNNVMINLQQRKEKIEAKRGAA